MIAQGRRKGSRGRLCLPLAACALVFAISFPAAARQTRVVEDPELLAPGISLVPESAPGIASAQQPSGEARPQTQGEQKPPDTEQQDKQSKSGTSKDRILFLLPNFLTLENAGNARPLKPAEKFKAVARGTFDPVQFAYYSILAGIGQASNSEPGYGQGMQGYGKRYGSIVGDTTIENFMVGAVLPSLLKQDPRYFQMGKGPVRHRAWYALTRIFVIRGDNGRAQFNASEIFGGALSAGIATYSYHPEDDRKLNNVMSVWGTQVALDGFANCMKEFWPDIRRHFHKKGTAAANTKAPGGG